MINANVERDGRPVAPRRMEDFRLLPGVTEAVQRLKDAGFLIVVVTNQPDVRTGHISAETIKAMHAELRNQMPLDDIKACFHVDADNCLCRKPRPGMILDAAREFDIDLPKSYVVGDRWRDIESGRNAGCLTILVDCGYEQDGPLRPTATVRSLVEAAAVIIDGRSDNQAAEGIGT
ncbi:D-glycero-alpha-D-manno-heptose-1,7-bisphosphate 7-phosphatase [Pseudolabrys taiwanensis]|uniref:D-glycero-alpha-D-manno-heptose-1,7-bisphosphate 7-phosphatase n=1 Tax=Pseudolabrys taiwanensis TaxID=331696 RepID=UPI001AECC061|nr:HAD-IIIA family hydrolase [Pseudolabrys taiwanensis]